MEQAAFLRLPSAAEATGAYPGAAALDLGNLLACDARGPLPEALEADATAACLEHGRDVLQRLLNELFALPVVPEQGLVLGRVVELPPPLTRLPREKPLPQPAPPTRWEAYAKSKGIVKRKRSARVFDEEAGEWRGRHGYRRAGDASDVAVVEAAAWETTGAVDPFTRQRREKKARLEAQEGRQVANLVAAARRGGASALQPAKATLSSLPALPGAPMGARQEHSLKKAAAIARLSTASMGKFDRRVEGEDKVRLKGKRRIVPGSRAAEQAAVASAMDKLQRRDAGKGKLVVDRALSSLAADKAAAPRAERKGALRGSKGAAKR